MHGFLWLLRKNLPDGHDPILSGKGRIRIAVEALMSNLPYFRKDFSDGSAAITPKLAGPIHLEDWEADFPEFDHETEPARVRDNLPHQPTSPRFGHTAPIPEDITAFKVASIAAQLLSPGVSIPESCDLAIQILRESDRQLKWEEREWNQSQELPDAVKDLIRFWRSVGDKIAESSDSAALFCESYWDESEAHLKQMAYPFPLSKQEVFSLSGAKKSSCHQHFKTLKESWIEQHGITKANAASRKSSRQDLAARNEEAFDRYIEREGIDRVMFKSLVKEWPALRGAVDRLWENFKKGQKNV